MADRRRRLDRVAVRRTSPAALVGTPAWQRARLQRLVALCAIIEGGLTRLGIDPAIIAAALARGKDYAAELAALPPPDESAGSARSEAPAVKPPDDPKAREADARFRGYVARYRDPATPPPDFCKVSWAMLYAYILARAPEAAPQVPSLSEGRI